MRIFDIIFRVVLGLLCISPILGTLGIFPPPTPEMYNTPEAFEFIDVLMRSGFVTFIMAVVFALSFVLVIVNRMALVAILILPITVNIIAFHLVLDGGIFTTGSIMANALVLINLYFLWKNRSVYKSLWIKN